MGKSWLFAMLLLFTVILAACAEGSAGTGGKKEADNVIDIVWYPNESGSDMKSSRDEIGKLIEETTDKTVEHHLTTDYAIAIETLVNNNADMAFMGAQGYIEANNKNDAVQPLAVPTGPLGTLEKHAYHNYQPVNTGDKRNYKMNDKFSFTTNEEKSKSSS